MKCVTVTPLWRRTCHLCCMCCVSFPVICGALAQSGQVNLHSVDVGARWVRHAALRRGGVLTGGGPVRQCRSVWSAQSDEQTSQPHSHSLRLALATPFISSRTGRAPGFTIEGWVEFRLKCHHAALTVLRPPAALTPPKDILGLRTSQTLTEQARNAAPKLGQAHRLI